MSPHIEIAEAVTNALNARTFSLPFRAERVYLPLYGADEIEDLRLAVVPRTQRRTPKTRGGVTDKEFDVDIGFLQRLRTADPIDHADSIMSLVEDVLELFENADSRPAIETEKGAALWFQSENNVPFGDRLMHEHNAFATAITLSYRVLS